MANLSSTQSKFLVVLDLDETIINDDSYTKVTELVPHGTISTNAREVLKNQGWPVYMRKVLDTLKDNGINENEIKKTVEDLPFTSGMHDLFRYLRENQTKFDLIVLSDANELFIHWILTKHNYSNMPIKVLTNPAKVTRSGLRLEDYHRQITCNNKCPENMCKRIVLKDFLHSVDSLYCGRAYVGDSVADLCPALLLGTGDTLFARKGYPLETAAIACTELSARLIMWQNGLEIVQVLETLSF